jgi:hypothetical protein
MNSKKGILKSASEPSQKVSKEPTPKRAPKPKVQPSAPTPKPVPKPAHESKQQPSALTPKTTKKRVAAKKTVVFKEGALKREQHPPKNIPIRLTKQNKEK